ncbi:hypothetical protein Thermo_00153 [Thermoplasmatales archaeon]|nr:hypothetical protein Thermo_00153 [Thermoplasmatales archaeon]
MICVYDREKKHESVVDQLFKPLGLPYTVITKLSANSVPEGTTAVVYFVDDKIDKSFEAYAGAPNRVAILIIIHSDDIVVDERIAVTCAMVKYDDKNITLTRSRLRGALTNKFLRRLNAINDFSVYMARNNLYPGQSYYTNPKNIGHFIDLLLSQYVDAKKVLVASRYNLVLDAPDVIRPENFIWVTDSPGPQKSRPVNLTFIVDSVIKKILEISPQIVYFDVFDFLMLYHPFYEIARGLEQIRSICLEKNIYLLAVIGHSSMDPVQYGQITRYGELWEPSEGIVDA